MKTTLLAITSVGLLGLALNSNPVLDEVKSGNKQLYCNGKHVAVEKIEGFDGNTWIFTNGYAKNCEVK